MSHTQQKKFASRPTPCRIKHCSLLRQSFHNCFPGFHSKSVLWLGPWCTIIQSSFSLIAQSVKNLPPVQETQVQFLGWEDPLEKEMATHSSILAWRTPWRKKSGRLQSMVVRVRHNLTTKPPPVLALLRRLEFQSYLKETWI